MICNARYQRRSFGHAIQLRGRKTISFRDAYTMLELVIVLAIIATLAAVSFPALMKPLAKSRVQEAAQELSRVVLKTRVRAMETGCEHRLRWRPGTGEYEVTEVRQLVAERELNATSPHRNRSANPEPRTPTGQQPAELDQRRPTSDKNSAQSVESHLARPYRVHERLGGDVQFRREHQSLGHHSLGRQPIGHQPLGQRPGPQNQANQPVNSQQHQVIHHRREGGQEHPVAHHLQSNDPHRHGQHPFHLPWSHSITFYPDGRADSASWTLRSDENYVIDVRLRGITGTIQVSSARLAPPNPLQDPNQTESTQPDARRTDPISQRPDGLRSGRNSEGGERFVP